MTTLITLPSYKALFVTLRDAYAATTDRTQRKMLLARGAVLSNAACSAGIGEDVRAWMESTM